MIENIEMRVDPRTAATDMLLRAAVSTTMGIDANRLRHIAVTRRSIDARQKRVMVNLGLRVWVDEEPESVSLVQPVEYRTVTGDMCVVVVGAGPS